MKHTLKNNRGFSLLEIVLYMSLSAIILGVASQMMRTHLDAYSFITNRQSALADVRYAINRMSYELLRVETADLIAIDDEQIDFVDEDGLNTSFSLGPAGGDGLNGLFRDDELLLYPVQSLLFRYFDANNVETAVIADIRQFEITITTQAVDTEGNITLTTKVTPRNFIYESYQ